MKRKWLILGSSLIMVVIMCLSFPFSLVLAEEIDIREVDSEGKVFEFSIKNSFEGSVKNIFKMKDPEGKESFKVNLLNKNNRFFIEMQGNTGTFLETFLYSEEKVTEENDINNRQSEDEESFQEKVPKKKVDNKILVRTDYRRSFVSVAINGEEIVNLDKIEFTPISEGMEIILGENVFFEKKDKSVVTVDPLREEQQPKEEKGIQYIIIFILVVAVLIGSVIFLIKKKKKSIKEKKEKKKEGESGIFDKFKEKESTDSERTQKGSNISDDYFEGKTMLSGDCNSKKSDETSEEERSEVNSWKEVYFESSHLSEKDKVVKALNMGYSGNDKELKQFKLTFLDIEYAWSDGTTIKCVIINSEKKAHFILVNEEYLALNPNHGSYRCESEAFKVSDYLIERCHFEKIYENDKRNQLLEKLIKPAKGRIKDSCFFVEEKGRYC